MESLYDLVEKHGAPNFLEAAAYYTCHLHPENVDKTIDEMESRWYDQKHQQTEAEKMLEDYNNGQTILNNQSLAYVDMDGYFQTM